MRRNSALQTLQPLLKKKISVGRFSFKRSADLTVLPSDMRSVKGVMRSPTWLPTGARESTAGAGGGAATGSLDVAQPRAETNATKGNQNHTSL